MKSFNVPGEIFPLFEVELILSAFLRWTRGIVTFRDCSTEDRGTELLVY